MKKQIFTLLSISLLFVLLSNAQTPIPNTGLTLKQGSTNYLDDSTYIFTDTKMNKTTDVQFVLRNVSGTLMAVTATTVVGDGFSKIGSIPSVLNDSQQVNFTIQFAPIAIKKYTAYLRITTDYSTDQFFQLNFEGNGLAAGTGINDPARNGICTVYPNPVKESANVYLNLADQSAGTFVLYNVRGQKVFSTSVSAFNSSFIFQRNNLPSGIYQYMIIDNQKGLQTTGKVLFE